ncbi:hypothetical protein F4860DRAFT_497440 [Xylaria cubensis]|nr:hypothetical protein F4860DRAFT_497440 [Xylaria cubensis]
MLLKAPDSEPHETSHIMASFANIAMLRPYPHRRPILFYRDSKLIMNFQPDSLFDRERYPRPLDFPRCTAAQIKALEVVQAVAEAHSYRFTTQTGDFYFLYYMDGKSSLMTRATKGILSGCG